MISVLIIAAIVNAQARTGIERLHRQDVAATLSGKADDLAKLWDNDAVRIQPGRPVEIGKAVIYANDKQWEASGGHGALCYVAEIQNVQIAGDWAFEWGYLSYKDSAKTPALRGKVSRVMKLQPDGTWKFTSVMVIPEKADSAAPMAHPCK
jgi:ketosteroid isomerase-like protein